MVAQGAGECVEPIIGCDSTGCRVPSSFEDVWW